MYQDITYNVLLQSDSKTIDSLRQTNKIANTISQDKQFWIDKFNEDHLESLLIAPLTDSYIKLYKYGEENIIKGKNILHINYLEKNRKMDNTDGIFKIIIEGNGGEIVSYLFNEKIKDIDIESFVYIQFALLKNEYQLTLKTWDNLYDLGTYSFKQVEQLIGPLLTITSLCQDMNNNNMIYKKLDNHVYNNRIRDSPSWIGRVLLIRRGMWEMIYTL